MLCGMPGFMTYICLQQTRLFLFKKIFISDCAAAWSGKANIIWQINALLRVNFSLPLVYVMDDEL
jgi:hypothetical protein